MYETLKRLYNTGRLTQEELHNAVDKEWITEEQYIEIVEGNENETDNSTDK